ncbi:helix-turn-helix domain-containing protein [Vibrio sp. WXL103]|uniref:helix-turn-helix domain-containing protein n=1 Tax=Vibrio sp. WXL103 TaxID=3450710 RepID=UPI003EC5E1A0
MKFKQMLEQRPHLYAQEVAHILRISKGTLANWRGQGKGPEWFVRENRPVYPTVKLKEYLERCGC